MKVTKGYYAAVWMNSSDCIQRILQISQGPFVLVGLCQVGCIKHNKLCLINVLGGDVAVTRPTNIQNPDFLDFVYF